MIEPDKIKGVILILIAIIVFSSFIFILFATDLGILLVKLTVLVIVGIILFIIGWIGVTLTINNKRTS